jgi:hypothetical protein
VRLLVWNIATDLSHKLDSSGASETFLAFDKIKNAATFIRLEIEERAFAHIDREGAVGSESQFVFFGERPVGLAE